MLAAMTPAEFAERYAEYLIDPGADSWEMVAALCATMHNIAVAQSGGKESAMISADDLMPKIAGEQREVVSAESFEQYARRVWG